MKLVAFLSNPATKWSYAVDVVWHQFSSNRGYLWMTSPQYTSNGE